MLVASGAIDPAVICGLNPEHAKLLGLTPPKASQVREEKIESLMHRRQDLKVIDDIA